MLVDAAANGPLEAGCGDEQNTFTLTKYLLQDLRLAHQISLTTFSRWLPCGDYMPMSEELGQSPSHLESDQSEGNVSKKAEHATEKAKAYR